MQPPVNSFDPPEGDIIPYPMSVLTLGGGRWLTMAGMIVDFPDGTPVDVQSNTLAYWEGRAAKAGSSLDELIV